MRPAEETLKAISLYFRAQRGEKLEWLQAYFVPDIADTLQVVAVTLELTGLLLVSLEVLHFDMADRIEGLMWQNA